MIESLDYIWMASYIISLSKSLLVVLIIGTVLLCVASILYWALWMDGDNRGHKIFDFGLPIMAFLFGFFLVIFPDQRTIKLFIGVKASQQVLTYIDNTEIPERAKHSVNLMWDKVDALLTEGTKDVSDSLATKVENVAKEEIQKGIQEVVK